MLAGTAAKATSLPCSMARLLADSRAVAGGAGQGGDGIQAVAADRLAGGDADLSFGGAFLEAAGDDRTEQGGDDGRGGGDEDG
ncbi:hypothetical protein [Streptomyces microflavus]|uniref:hypothetical protein n=2 Tax=Streptomyces microflavus TaxID=1919 RepID=UPI0038272722